MNIVGQVVVQVRECNPVLSTDRLPDNNLIYVIKFVPIFITTRKIEYLKKKKLKMEKIKKRTTQEKGDNHF